MPKAEEPGLVHIGPAVQRVVDGLATRPPMVNSVELGENAYKTLCRMCDLGRAYIVPAPPKDVLPTTFIGLKIILDPSFPPDHAEAVFTDGTRMPVMLERGG